jgi:hypothetical protein
MLYFPPFTSFCSRISFAALYPVNITSFREFLVYDAMVKFLVVRLPVTPQVIQKFVILLKHNIILFILQVSEKRYVFFFKKNK